VTIPSRVQRAVAEAHRNEWGVVLAATARTTRDLDLAEECVQDAYAKALVAWVRDGVPANPAAWLVTTAKHGAVDALRRDARHAAKLPLLVEADDAAPTIEQRDDAHCGIHDERLRLIFMCCHPALNVDAQLGLTLRLVCGVATTDVATALLVSESTMAARLTRAKRKIAVARIPMRVPRPDELADRLDGVLGVVHLLFTTGHTAPSGTDLTRTDVADEAIRLARVLAELLPDEDSARALLALLLATDARRATRVDDAGALVVLADQDRRKWDRAALAEARVLVDGVSLANANARRFALQAQIALAHAEAPMYEDTDWEAIVALYDQLLAAWPSPVVALNRAVAVSMAHGPRAALDELDRLAASGTLSEYRYVPVVRADLLWRLELREASIAATRAAIEVAGTEVERAHLTRLLIERGGS
jgi:RNA polymerase sigma-70 factor, ECF subfamily